MKRLVLIPLIMSVAACDKTPPETAMSKQMFEYKKAQVSEQLDLMPKWYTDIPKDDNAVYAVGTAQTPDMQMTVDIAILSAKTTLADRANSRLRSQLKLYKTKLGVDDFDSVVQNNFEQVTRNIIADADVAGYTVKETKLVQNGTQFRAYVLLEYKDSVANQMIKTRLANNEPLYTELRAAVAFKEMDDAVEAQKDSELNEKKVIIDKVIGLQTPKSVVE